MVFGPVTVNVIETFCSGAEFRSSRVAVRLCELPVTSGPECCGTSVIEAPIRIETGVEVGVAVAVLVAVDVAVAVAVGVGVVVGVLVAVGVEVGVPALGVGGTSVDRVAPPSNVAV